MPLISNIQNNYSYLLPGMPNYGIAPGSIFVIIGTNLSSAQSPVLQSSAPPGLPTTLNQTTVSVKVNGVVTTPALYYASANQVAAVLPSTTPVGNGTLTVSVNGQPSAPAAIQVVASAVGLDTLYGAGVGAGIVEDSNFNVLRFTNSAKPGQSVSLWGSGIGADPSNDDRTYPQSQNNLTGIPTQAFIGGISASVTYSGRSQYPGLDQYNVVIPANVPLGCFVSVVVQTGNVVSNAVTIPVSANGGSCSDPTLGLSGSQLAAQAAKTTPINAMFVGLVQSTDLNGTNDGAVVFAGSAGSAVLGAGYFYASEGSCAVIQPGLPIPISAALDPGTIQLSGPVGNLNVAAAGGGEFNAKLPVGSLTNSPGTYTFTGSGGANVGSFQVAIAINMQSPFSLTNTAALATVTRSQGATVTWTGGFAGGYVYVNGVGPFYPNRTPIFTATPPQAPGNSRFRRRSCWQ